jgi:gamma-glutamyltranspeptidase / glutathione hydrolase
VALNGSGRAPAGLTPQALRAAGMTTVPIRGHRGGDRARRHRRLLHGCPTGGGMARLDATVLAPRSAMPTGRAGRAPRRLGLGRMPLPRCRARARAYLMGGRPRPGQVFRAPGQAEVLRRIAARAAPGSTRARWPRTWSPACARWAACTRCPISPPRAATTPSRSRLYRGTELVEHAAQRAGRDGDPAAEHPVAFRPQARWTRFGAERAASGGRGDKLAYDARNRFIADPTTSTRLAHMLSPDTAARLAALIDPKPAPWPIGREAERGGAPRHGLYHRGGPRPHGGLADLFDLHPSARGSPRTKFGILFQNRGAGFTLEEGHPNEWPGQAPDAHDHPRHAARGRAASPCPSA